MDQKESTHLAGKHVQDTPDSSYNKSLFRMWNDCSAMPSKRRPITRKKHCSLVEEQLPQAAKDGLFENLEGKGKPLDLEEWKRTPPELRMGYSILKSAGIAPQEVQLKGTIGTLKQEIGKTDDPVLKKELIDKLNKHLVDLRHPCRKIDAPAPLALSHGKILPPQCQ